MESAEGFCARSLISLSFMRERRSLPISSEVALKNDKDGSGKLAVNSVLCGVVDELSNGRTGRRGSWVRHAVMGVLRWKDLTGVRTSTPTDQKEVGTSTVLRITSNDIMFVHFDLTSFVTLFS